MCGEKNPSISNLLVYKPKAVFSVMQHTHHCLCFIQDVMKSIGKSLSSDSNSNSADQEVPKRTSEFDLKIPGQTFLWQADERATNCDKVGCVVFTALFFS